MIERDETLDERDVQSVLVVDDVVEIRYLVRILLANVTLCQVVAEAENGEEAIDPARRLQPDIVVLDVATRVVVYSSRPEARDEALRLGAARYRRRGAIPHAIAETVSSPPSNCG